MTLHCCGVLDGASATPLLPDSTDAAGASTQLSNMGLLLWQLLHEATAVLNAQSMPLLLSAATIGAPHDTFVLLVPTLSFCEHATDTTAWLSVTLLPAVAVVVTTTTTLAIAQVLLSLTATQQLPS
ncbi:hypothetical protein NP493_25g01009 [Ridgeia piscesae]|uniref:Uncharacterized protein n=1 Tax=Ridgeia piscesae TaxID=27915 RepID=A0AAD9UKJ6_RIDPI|nr:hypothetical protein NP493_25g01009 [Ridgeia piscesae]